jgi:hypothetical protein
MIFFLKWKNKNPLLGDCADMKTNTLAQKHRDTSEPLVLNIRKNIKKLDLVWNHTSFTFVFEE